MLIIELEIFSPLAEENLKLVAYDRELYLSGYQVYIYIRDCHSTPCIDLTDLFK